MEPSRGVACSQLHDAAYFQPSHVAVLEHDAVPPRRQGGEVLGSPLQWGGQVGGAEKEPNYLAKALKQGLRNGDGACFDFMIQRRKDAKDMPIEDSTVTWSEDDSPFVPVAKIRVPAQAFDSTLQQRYCENLSFSPRHATTQAITQKLKSNAALSVAPRKGIHASIDLRARHRDLRTGQLICT